MQLKAKSRSVAGNLGTVFAFTFAFAFEVIEEVGTFFAFVFAFEVLEEEVPSQG